MQCGDIHHSICMLISQAVKVNHIEPVLSSWLLTPSDKYLNCHVANERYLHSKVNRLLLSCFMNCCTELTYRVLMFLTMSTQVTSLDP